MAENNRVEPAVVKRQAALLRDTANDFIKSISKVNILLDEMSSLCRSEDNRLSEAIGNINSNYSYLVERGYYHFDDLALRMDNWADVTMKFETEAAEKIQNLNNGLNDISGLLNQLR